MEINVLGGGLEVGRSAFLVKDRGMRILLDYGVNFDINDNPQLPLHVRPVDVSALVVSHAHLDHIGAAPYLFITGKIPVYATKPTMDLARLLIIDFLRLNAAVIEYEMRDFENMYLNTVFMEYGKAYEENGIKLRFLNAGHILGSAMTYIEMPSGEKILYTGDFNDIDTLTLPAAETPPSDVTTFIMESTYGSRNHPPRHIVEKKLIEIVEETIDKGGVVLIPAFSVGRSQEIAALIYHQAPYIDIYIDGMSRDITEIYLKYKMFLRDPTLFSKIAENINFVTDTNMRKKIIKKPCVIIASAGMLKGGPSLYYLKKIYANPKNTVILVSYQAPNSNGHKILEDGVLRDQSIKGINARLEWLDFSSHAGCSGLINLVKKCKHSLKNIVLIHGSPEDVYALENYIKTELNEDINIYTPRNGDVLRIES
ncbi:MAG: MBL fold metallo-hydrolase [Desulfurococcaceae archaeon]